MKKTIISLIICSIAFFNIKAQNFKAENKYLQIINNQEIDLIADNIRNAEFIADSYVFSDKNLVQDGDLFFLNFAKSYHILRQNEYAVFSIIRQRVFFPNDTLNNFCEDVFYDAIKIIDDLKLAEEVYLNTEAEKIPKSKPAKIEYLLKQMFLLNIAELDKALFKYSEALKPITKKPLPIFIKQWRFYTMIKLDPETKKRAVDFSGKLYKIDYYSHINSDPIRIEVLKKAYCYFKKREDFEKADHYKKLLKGFNKYYKFRARRFYCK